ncbi:hypothetical protein ACFLXW_00455 [Candidatus Dependentiae bacterium]
MVMFAVLFFSLFNCKAGFKDTMKKFFCCCSKKSQQFPRELEGRFTPSDNSGSSRRRGSRSKKSCRGVMVLGEDGERWE